MGHLVNLGLSRTEPHCVGDTLDEVAAGGLSSDEGSGCWVQTNPTGRRSEGVPLGPTVQLGSSMGWETTHSKASDAKHSKKVEVMLGLLKL